MGNTRFCRRQAGRRMNPGYCFVLCPKHTGTARTASSELWEHEVYSPDGRERCVFARMIDGYACFVFQCPDGRLRAQLCHATREVRTDNEEEIDGGDDVGNEVGNGESSANEEVNDETQ